MTILIHVAVGWIMKYFQMNWLYLPLTLRKNFHIGYIICQQVGNDGLLKTGSMRFLMSIWCGQALQNIPSGSFVRGTIVAYIYCPDWISDTLCILNCISHSLSVPRQQGQLAQHWPKIDTVILSFWRWTNVRPPTLLSGLAVHWGWMIYGK